VALDKYSEPDFRDPKITFYPCDLSSAEALSAIAEKFQHQFEVAVCLEVAEHLDPAVSDNLVRFLCTQAKVVVFSAAVPGQGGDAHINCQPREAWHERFTQQGFNLVHHIRPRLVGHSALAPWYRFNILDYAIDERATESEKLVPLTLLAVESALATEFYTLSSELVRLQGQLRYPPVQLYLSMRAALKSLIRGKKSRIRGEGD
jgi:hypothetical protein